MKALLARLWLPVLTVLLLVGLRVIEPAPLVNLRLLGFDVLTRMNPRPLTPLPDGGVEMHTLVVDIDEESLKRFGQWPWPRTRLAELIDHLKADGAQVIAMDMMFPESDRVSPDVFAAARHDLSPDLQAQLAALPKSDTIFANALRGSPVVLGQAAITIPDDEKPAALAAVKADQRPPQTTRVLSRPPADAPDPTLSFVSDDALIRNLPLLEDAAAGIGQITPRLDGDGVIRRVPMIMRVGLEEPKQLVPALTTEILRVAAGARLSLVQLDETTHKPFLVLKRGGGQPPSVIPLNRDGTVNVWYNPSEPARKILLSAAKVFDDAPETRVVRGKLVLIGTSAAGLADLRNTPLGIIPGVEVHAQLLETVIGGRYFHMAEQAKAIEILLILLSAIIVLSTVPFLSPKASLPLLPALLALLLGGGYLLFSHKGILVDAILPAISATILHGQALYGNFAAAERKRRQLRAAFSQYLSPALVRQLAENPDRLTLGGESRDMTFLFTDIAGFTSFTEKNTPTDLVRLLNEYLDEACRIVMDHGGTIDKIVGDAIHAMFNAPLDQPDHAARAVACALALDIFGRKFQADSKAAGFDFGETRIGLNAGPAVVGNFGGARRFDYTAHGDSINTAARMESVNKHLGTTVCVSGPVVERMGKIDHFRKIGVLILKGKTEGIAAYEPLSAREIEGEPLRRYRDAYDLMRDKSPQALAAFTQLHADYPSDPVIAFHVKRLSAGEQGEIIRFSEK